MSKHRIQAFEIATDRPGHFVEVVVRYPALRPRGFVLEVEPFERRDGIEVRTFSIGRPGDSREAPLEPATRFNRRRLEKLAAAVRTPGTPEWNVAKREFRAFLAASGTVAPVHPFGV